MCTFGLLFSLSLGPSTTVWLNGPQTVLQLRNHAPIITAAASQIPWTQLHPKLIYGTKEQRRRRRYGDMLGLNPIKCTKAEQKENTRTGKIIGFKLLLALDIPSLAPSRSCVFRSNQPNLFLAWLTHWSLHPTHIATHTHTRSPAHSLTSVCTQIYIYIKYIYVLPSFAALKITSDGMVNYTKRTRKRLTTEHSMEKSPTKNWNVFLCETEFSGWENR